MSMRLRQHHIANSWPAASPITPDLQATVWYWRPHAVPPLSVNPVSQKVRSYGTPKTPTTRSAFHSAGLSANR